MFSACSPLLLIATASLAPADTTPKALEGVWVFETAAYDGSVSAAGPGVQFSPEALEIKGDRLRIRLPGGRPFDLGLVIDDSVTPKRIEASGGAGHACRGIFMLDGDLLVICVRLEDNGKRPTKFAALADDKTFLYFLHRQR